MLKYVFFLTVSFSSYASEPKGIPYNWHVPQNVQELSSWSTIASYQLASYLTDPLCKAREYSVRSQMIEDLSPSSSIKNSLELLCTDVEGMQLAHECSLHTDQVAHFIERSLLMSGGTAFSLLTPFTAIPATFLRSLTSYLETEKFIHYTGFFSEKELDEAPLSHMLWNICGIKAGYEVEEGGQMPIQDDFVPYLERRIFHIAQKILEEDPDVLCLNEVFDLRDALYLVSSLQKRYAHFVVHCGARGCGLNSGLFFATKFKISSISFTSFPKEMLHGAAKYAEKGFLSVQTEDSKGRIARFITTHLQHSEQPEFPTEEEMRARKEELAYLLHEIDPNDTVILAGDLNLEDSEWIKKSPETYFQFKKTLSYSSFPNEAPNTWLGDAWYVEYGNRDSTFSLISGRKDKKRTPSRGINLDHVLAKIAQEPFLTPEIHTVLKATGYDPQKISRDSLSDHMILMSEILLKRE